MTIEVEIHWVSSVPKTGGEHYVDIPVVDSDGVLNEGTYDSYYGVKVYWKNDGPAGGYWEGGMEYFWVRPHRSTMRHEYIDFTRDPQMVAPTECTICEMGHLQSSKGHRETNARNRGNQK